jgi:hypothetical protein
MEQRFATACRIAGALIAQGEEVFSPIVHCHPIAVRCGLPTGWPYWRPYCLAMLALASRVLVAKLPGWRTSKGVAAEINRARAWGIEVAFSRPEFLLRAKTETVTS